MARETNANLNDRTFRALYRELEPHVASRHSVFAHALSWCVDYIQRSMPRPLPPDAVAAAAAAAWLRSDAESRLNRRLPRRAAA